MSRPGPPPETLRLPVLLCKAEEAVQHSEQTASKHEDGYPGPGKASR